MLHNDDTVSVADKAAAALKRHGVEFIFGQSIPTALHLAAGDIGIAQIAYRTENAGAAMADAFARVSGRIGVVTAQNGPAATLLVPGLAEALKSSVPVLAIVQDVQRDQTDRNAFQELDHVQLFQACAKWVRRCTEAGRVEDYIDMAVTAAVTGRPGPAVLVLPMDIFNERTVATSGRSANLGAFPLDRLQPERGQASRVADLIRHARAPVVIAGGGVHLSRASEALRRIQSDFGLPVATTVNGKGAVDEDSPLSIGVVGNFMGRHSATQHMTGMLREADFVLLVGTRTAQNGTDSWRLFGDDTTFAHIDIDGMEVGRNYESVRLVGDARATLELLHEELSKSPRAADRARPSAQTIEAARRLHGEQSAGLMNSGQRPIRPERIMKEASHVIGDETIVVADASYATVWMANYLRARGRTRFLAPRGLAGLGWGLPMAIGAKVASPGSRVLCFVGDGGFAHVWSEMETARRIGAQVVTTVFNNQVLGFQKDAENIKFGRHSLACHLAPVDHAAIALACGCFGLRIEDPDDYAPALDAALRSGLPAVLDVVSDPDAFPPLGIFEPFHNGAPNARAAAHAQVVLA